MVVLCRWTAYFTNQIQTAHAGKTQIYDGPGS